MAHRPVDRHRRHRGHRHQRDAAAPLGSTRDPVRGAGAHRLQLRLQQSPRFPAADADVCAPGDDERGARGRR